MEAVLGLCDGGLCLAIPSQPLLLRRGATTIVVRGVRRGGRYVVVFSSPRVRRFFKSLLGSLEKGQMKAPRPLSPPVAIPVEVTKRGVVVADEFYNSFLVTLYTLEYLDELLQQAGGRERLLLLRRVSALSIVS